MTTSDEQAAASMRRAAEQLADMIARVERMAKIRRSTGFIVPVLESDPDADDPTNLWGFADGQLNFRTPDGAIHRYQPSTGAPVAIPTLAGTPAFSSGHRLWFDSATGALQGYLQNGTVQTYSADAAATSTAGGGPSSPGSSSSKPKPADPKPKSYRKTYSSNWQRTYCSRHGVEGSERYGTYGGTHGERKIMFGFPDEVMRADLAGARVTRVELRMRNTDSWGYAGIDVHFGLHRQDDAPGSFSQTRRDVFVDHWPQSGWGGGTDGWRQTAASIGIRFRDDEARGLTIDQPSGQTSYGECDRSSLQLRISYVK